MRAIGVFFVLFCVCLVSSASNDSAGMKIFNGFPESIKSLSKDMMPNTLKTWPFLNPFYSFKDHVDPKQDIFLLGRMWVDNNITYKIHEYSTRMDRAFVDRSISLAFDQFRAILPLTFTQVTGDCAHLNIRWKNRSGPHGQVSTASNKLTDITFEDDYHFDTDCKGKEVCLWTGVMHEIGHALGLGHFFWKHSDGVMNGRKNSLGPDDITLLQLLYGDKQGTMPGVRPLLLNFAEAQVQHAEGSCSHVPFIAYKYENHKFEGSLITKYCTNQENKPQQCLLVGCENDPADEKCFPVLGLLIRNYFYTNHH